MAERRYFNAVSITVRIGVIAGKQCAQKLIWFPEFRIIILYFTYN